MDDIKIDVTQIPGYAGYLLTAPLVKIINKFYEDPQHQADFEVWKKARDQAKGRKSINRSL